MRLQRIDLREASPARHAHGDGLLLSLCCDDLAAQRSRLMRLAVQVLDEHEDDGEAPSGMQAPVTQRLTRLTLSAAETGSCGLAFVGEADAMGACASQGIRSIDLSALAPERLAAHWAQILGRRVTRDSQGTPQVELDGSVIRFVLAIDGREGLSAIQTAD